ncbi:MAG: DUF2027 domain-containing protein [Bacteroidales bacterium]
MNSFKPGDKVRFLNDVGEGIVKYIRGDKVFVETPDGFEIPVKPNELVAGRDMFPGEENRKEKPAPEAKLPSTVTRKQKPSDKPVSEKKINQSPQDSGKILLAVVPTNPFAVSVSDFELYLINDSDWDVYYTLSSLANRQLLPLGDGKMEAGTKIRIDILSQTRISKESLKLQLIFLREGLHPFREPVVTDVPLHLTAFYKQKAFSENDFFENPAFIETLVDLNQEKKETLISLDELKQLVNEKSTTQLVQKSKPKEKEDDPQQVDLHIHEIMENSTGLNPQEILNIQMARFTTALDTAIEARQKRIIFIHGIGNGRLKYEIRKKLDTDYSNLRYQDASFQEYGFGATLVFLH